MTRSKHQLKKKQKNPNKQWQKKHLLLTCVLDVSMVGIGLAFGSERETYQYTSKNVSEFVCEQTF